MLKPSSQVYTAVAPNVAAVSSTEPLVGAARSLQFTTAEETQYSMKKVTMFVSISSGSPSALWCIDLHCFSPVIYIVRAAGLYFTKYPIVDPQPYRNEQWK